MEKNCHSAGDSCSSTVTTAASSGNKDNLRLKHLSLNKLSYKISKPTSAAALTQPSTDLAAVEALDHHHHHHLAANLQQPPVYNINKSDFREVVQKLTGAPPHERISSPPPIQPPKPPSSRLQRIRPPPLPQLSPRPPLNIATRPSLLQDQNPNPGNQTQIPPPSSSSSDLSTNSGITAGFNPITRLTPPLSPLPPLPSVLAAAESPVSAYMRYLQSTTASGNSRPSLFPGFSPPATLPPPPAPAPTIQSPPAFQLPLSPLPFGCLNSPRSPYALLSPGLLFSPSSGQLGFPQFPLSPTVPVPSPTYK